MQNVQNILFDLDGTLTDPKEGITNSISYAFEQMDYPSRPPDEITRYIGPPLHHYFTEILGAEKAAIAVGHYRRRYNDEGMGLIENAVYADIPPILAVLRQYKEKLFVVTSKPKIVAEKIIRHFSLDHFFNHIYGAELDERMSDKAELIAHVLEQEKLHPDNVVMIGDRKHDIIGATENKVRSIGVCWGYGSAEELQMAGATFLAPRPKDLLTILLDSYHL